MVTSVAARSKRDGSALRSERASLPFVREVTS
jgi:hypothetical protein